MEDRTRDKIRRDDKYILQCTREHNDLKLMLDLIRQELQRRAR